MREAREEIRFYLEERAREFEAQGMDPDEARRAAARAFGDVDAVERATVAQDRMATGRTMMGAGTVMQDVRFALRSLGRSPGFAFVALVTLALGIGASTAIYSVAEGVFLHAPPVRDPGTLVTVYTTCSDGRPRCSSSYPDYADYRERSALLADLAAVSRTAYSVAPEGGAAELLTVHLVTGNYFQVLGLSPAAGRLLQPADHDPDGPVPVAVLAHDAWRTFFGSDPGVVGRTVRVNETPVEVVGVAPEGFRGTGLTDDPDLFLPMATGALMGTYPVGAEGTFDARGERWIDSLVGRLAPSASVGALQDEMGRIAADLNAAYPDERGTRSATVESVARYTLPQFGRDELTRMILVLAFMVGATLLLACANLANILLARAAERRSEMGVRLALGAGAGRLLRQLLTESLVLAVGGGVLGIGTAMGILELLGRFTLPGGVTLEHVGAELDGSALLFVMGLSVATGVVFGLAPAVRSTRADVLGSLRGEVAGRGRGEALARKGLVALQVGLCFVLLSGAGLFLRTLHAGLGTDLGFRHENVALLRFDLAVLRYEADEGVQLLETMRTRLEALPGVTSASYGTRVPLQNGGNRGAPAEVDGYAAAPGEEIPVQYIMGGPGFLSTLGVETTAGADALGGRGGSPAGEGVVVDGLMAERYWSGGGAVGGTVVLGGMPLPVAGVTRPVRWREVAEPPTNYVVIPVALAPALALSTPLTFAVRTRGDPTEALPLLRGELQALEPRLTFFFVSSAEELLAADLAPQRMGGFLLGAFAILALVLAGVGVGGVVAHAVSRRRRDIGLRMALGAAPGRVVRGMAAEMAGPVAAGVAGGLGVALLLRSAVEAFLIGIAPEDPTTYAAAALVLCCVAAAAAVVPARAAARVEPSEALRAE